MFDRLIRAIQRRNRNFRNYELEIYMEGFRRGREFERNMNSDKAVITGISVIDQDIRQIQQRMRKR